MKKEAYIKPAIEVIEMEAETMIAASVKVGKETKDATEAWSNERRGTWGNLWSNGEE